MTATTAPTIGDQLTGPAVTPTAPPPRPKARAGPVEWIIVHIAFVAISAIFLVPFLWLLSAAFDGKASAYLQLPVEPTLNNFVRIFTEHDFAHVLANSVFVAVATMILVVFAVALAGYSLSRLDLRRKDWITYAVLLLQTMPISATMVPIYGLARQLGLRNSYLGLILIHAAIELPFLIWLMKGSSTRSRATSRRRPGSMAGRSSGRSSRSCCRSPGPVSGSPPGSPSSAHGPRC
jgi:ABC-type spermidine/putrescine transport system permease subunit II